MSLIDREGTYLARIDDHGVSETKNNIPQWCAYLYATHIYVEEADCEAWGLTEPGWADLDDFDMPREITAYQTLFGHSGDPTLGYDQVQAATGWDGASFAALNTMDLNGHVILIRTAVNEYNGKSRMNVDWVDNKDASPTRSLRKLDSDGLKDLDARFGNKMNAGKKATPAKAPAKAAEKSTTKAVTTPAAKKKSAAPPASKKETVEAPPEKDAGLAPAMDKAEAWGKLCEVSENVDDDARNAAWLTGCEAVGGDPDDGGRDEDDFTDEDWGRVFATACTELGITAG